MTRFLKGTRYLILVPILGLALAAGFFYIFGGLSLIILLFDLLLHVPGAAHAGEPVDKRELVVEVVEYVHFFLVGTVLFITAAGLYQLFIARITFEGWPQIRSIEELETNLIGVTVVVLAVDFMSEAITESGDALLQSGAAIALPIAALGVFVGMRAWAAGPTGPHGTRDGESPPNPEHAGDD